MPKNIRVGRSEILLSIYLFYFFFVSFLYADLGGGGGGKIASWGLVVNTITIKPIHNEE